MLALDLHDKQVR